MSARRWPHVTPRRLGAATLQVLSPHLVVMLVVTAGANVLTSQLLRALLDAPLWLRFTAGIAVALYAQYRLARWNDRQDELDRGLNRLLDR